MSKQADAILGMYLHSNFFSREELRRNYDFYQELTLHHSSLSTCIFGIVACDIGYMEQACSYFQQSARMDLDDYHHNFYAGIHAANMAGTWQMIVNGFAGMRCQKSILSFSPRIPKGWDSYSFHIKFRGQVLSIVITEENARFDLLEGDKIQFYVNGKKIILNGQERRYFEKI